LRRLCPPEARPGAGAPDERGVSGAGFLERIADRNRGNRSLATAGKADHRLDDSAVHEWPGTIVYQDHLALFTQRREPGANRIAAVGSTRDDGEAGEVGEVGEECRRMACVFRRKDQHNLGDIRMGGEGAQRAEHHGHTGDR